MELGRSALVAFGVALLVGLVVTPLVRRAAVGASLLDEPGGRKIHVRAIPRLGGAAMLVAVGAALAAVLGLSAALAGSSPVNSAFVATVVGVVIVGGVGLIDDLRDLPPAAKLGGQIAGAVAVVWLGLSIDSITVPWGAIDLGPLGPILTVIWLVAVVNAVNLIDGLDGLAGGVALIAAAAFAALAWMLGATGVLLPLAAGAGAVLAFLAYNRPPALIIMGDAGSMFLGMLLGCGAVALGAAPGRHLALVAAVVALGVPLFDMTWAVVRRLAAGRSVFAADSGHIHHRLLHHGLSQTQAAALLVGVSALLGLVAVIIGR